MKRTVLLLMLGLVAGVHGSDSESDPETKPTQLEKLAKTIRVRKVSQEEFTTEELAHINRQFDDLYINLGRHGSRTKQDFEELAAVRHSLSEPCQAKKPAPTITIPTITVSEVQ